MSFANERNAILSSRKGKHRRRSAHLASALQRGDLISLIAPSSPFDPEKFREASFWLEERGYKVLYNKNIFSKSDYLAGEDDRRSHELNQAFTDSKSKAIFSARGGYGATRIIESLQMKNVRKNKKIFMGLSDLTVLLNYISKKTGFTTIHGPVVAGESFLSLSPELRSQLFEKLENGETTELHEPIDFRTLSPGKVKAKLWGGNLCMVEASISTSFEVPFNGILFLEEVKEPKYRIDRMLCHLSQIGALKKVKGIMLGQFSDLDRSSHDLSWLKSLIEKFVGNRKIPIVAGIKAGHDKNEVWLPIGGFCNINTEKRIIQLSPLVA